MLIMKALIVNKLLLKGINREVQFTLVSKCANLFHGMYFVRNDEIKMSTHVQKNPGAVSANG